MTDTYVHHAREALVRTLPRDIGWDGPMSKLFDLYVLLVLTTGEDTESEDVHDAWAVWRQQTNPEHPSIVPFHDLTEDVQKLDDLYRDAIRDAAAQIRRSGERSPLAAHAAVLAEISHERVSQDARWGEQNHPDGTGDEDGRLLAVLLRGYCDSEHHAGEGTFAQILAEEVGEAFAEDDPAALRRELVQVAAVAACWIQSIDRRAVRQAKPPTTFATDGTVTLDRGDPLTATHITVSTANQED